MTKITLLLSKIALTDHLLLTQSATEHVTTSQSTAGGLPLTQTAAD